MSAQQVQISIDQDTFDRLQMLMVPPVSDANAVIKSLLVYDGRASPAAITLGEDGHHYTYAQELERANRGVYDGGGCT